MLSIIILAAGLSKRMGERNKLRLPFRHLTILQHTIQNILDADMGEVIVVVGHERDLILSDLGVFEGKIKTVFNSEFAKGMTTSIQKGVEMASDTEGYMICLSDMPLIQPVEYQRISQYFFDIKNGSSPIVLPFYEGQKGNPVVFHKSYRNEILNLKNTEGGKPIVENYKSHVWRVEMLSDTILLDADTPEAYENLILGK